VLKNSPLSAGYGEENGVNVTYIKICPNCGHHNAEIPKCSKCKYFIGDVDSVPACEASGNISDDSDSAEPDDHEQPHKTNGYDDTCSVQEEQPHTLGGPKTTMFSPTPMLSLEYSGCSYDVEPGTIMGKADATSSANLQIPGLPNYIHRRHCRFDFQNGQWQVTAIENEEFTNPTFVNSNKVQPNQSLPLKNGDRLILCDVSFNVRMLQ
jgi:hypothetical protein